MAIPASLHRNAAIQIDKMGLPAITSSTRLQLTSVYDAVTEVDIILSDPQFIHHYFHFIEISIAALTMIATYTPGASVRGVYFGSQAWNNPTQNFVQKEIIHALFKPKQIIEGKPDGEYARSNFLILVVDQSEAIDTHYNKYITYMIANGRRAFPVLRSRALEFAGATSPQRFGENEYRALYVKRGPPRTFSPGLEGQFLQMFADRNLELETVDFTDMSWAEQVKSTSDANLLVGIHGNGLTNCLWMPPGAFVIEIFPQDAHHYDYQMLSEIATLNYFGIEGRAEHPFVFTSGSRFGAAYGDVNAQIAELPWPFLTDIIENISLYI